MLISFEKPPIYDEAVKHFAIDPKHTVFTYGDTLYNPGGLFISEDLYVHEETHAEQQGHGEEGAKVWWDRYLTDPLFRVEQEAEAYGRQYACICQKVKDRNKRVVHLNALAHILAGPLYGKAISPTKSMKMIREASGVVA